MTSKPCYFVFVFAKGKEHMHKMKKHPSYLGCFYMYSIFPPVPFPFSGRSRTSL